MTDPRSTPEYRALLARVQHLNGVQARLGALADWLADTPGSAEHATVAVWLYRLLDDPDTTPPAQPATEPDQEA